MGPETSSNDDSSAVPVTAKTPTESDVYDRQIRLWGAESQAKMQKSRVLYIHVTGCSAEIIKNMVLAGIAATLCDTRSSQAQSTSAHFLSNPDKKKFKAATVAEAIQPQVEALNPLLGSCPLLAKSAEDLTREDLKAYTVVVASQVPLKVAVKLSSWAVENGSYFYAADCFGMNGAAMIDLGKDFQYRPELGKNKLLDPTGLKKYVALSDLVQVPLRDCVNRFYKTPPSVWLLYRCLMDYQEQMGSWPSSSTADSVEETTTVFQEYLEQQGISSVPKEDLEQLARSGMAQTPPVCSVLGGLLGNEIIKVISGKGEPANNTFLLNGTTCKAMTFLVQPKTAK